MLEVALIILVPTSIVLVVAGLVNLHITAKEAHMNDLSSSSNFTVWGKDYRRQAVRYRDMRSAEQAADRYVRYFNMEDSEEVIRVSNGSVVASFRIYSYIPQPSYRLEQYS